MPGAVVPFSEEQMRLLVNLEQQYEVWIEAERRLFALPYGLKWKRISGRDYLYEVTDRVGNGRSLGPRSVENEVLYADYRRDKAEATERRDLSAARLAETARLYRALRLPLLASEAARILREADRRALLGTHLIVIGTNAMPAYAVEAGGLIRGAPEETEDFDMAWIARQPDEDAPDGDRPAPVWTMLKAVDPTYTVNTERSFQARNAAAYEVEILTAPSRAAGMGRTDRPRPTPLEEQEWLLLGRPVARTVVARDGSPARIVAPDPRWFALHKLWMSAQAKRNPLKRPKDAKQGTALLDAVAEAMPQFPLDAAFAAELPDELAPHYAAWESRRPEAALPRW